MNKKKANAKKRAKQMEAGKKRRLHKQILKEAGRNKNISNPKLSFLIERFKSLYGEGDK